MGAFFMPEIQNHSFLYPMPTRFMCITISACYAQYIANNADK
ncbi:hypothetical protein PLIP_a3239 [Pseudoalteromonas lipolytica LMEB 39]|nr:hypothetical protein [Pseudoalteromonas lipolytica LMEB 39]